MIRKEVATIAVTEQAEAEENETTVQKPLKLVAIGAGSGQRAMARLKLRVAESLRDQAHGWRGQIATVKRTWIGGLLIHRHPLQVM